MPRRRSTLFTAFGKDPYRDLRAVPAHRVGDRRDLPGAFDDDDAINHDPAHMFMNTGSQIAGRPSMGAWVTYGLGSEAEDLPGFVVLTSLGSDAATLVSRLAEAGLRTFASRSFHDAAAQLRVIITASHQPSELWQAARLLRDVLRTPVRNEGVPVHAAVL